MFLLISLLAVVNMSTAQQRTTLSAQVYGYQNDMVYFDCIQTPLIAKEFHTNPGEEHLYNFDCDRLVCITINGRTNVMLQPGDSLHVDVNYDGKNVNGLSLRLRWLRLYQIRMMSQSPIHHCQSF